MSSFTYSSGFDINISIEVPKGPSASANYKTTSTYQTVTQTDKKEVNVQALELDIPCERRPASIWFF